MKITDLKALPVGELISLGESSGLENASRMKRQDIVFGILKNKAKEREDIDGGGVLEILQDGFGFLRSPDSSYLAGPDDIYVSPSQIRRFGLRTGDTIAGKIRPPKEGESLNEVKDRMEPPLGAGRFIKTPISPQVEHYFKRGDLCVSTIIQEFARHNNRCRRT